MPTRILIIEDNEANLELMRYLVEAFGHSTITATDGEEGLRLALDALPELIICDVQLPRIDGIDLARRLKSNGATRGLHLIAVTSYAMVGDRDKMLAAGFDGYLSKPIDPESFVAQVEAFLPSGSRSAAPPMPRQEPAVPVAMPPVPAPGGPLILLVDNTTANISHLRCLLEPLGYGVAAATDVAAALQVTREVAPDLILTDVHMPARNGFDLLRTLKGDARLASIPVIVLTSTAWRSSDRDQAIALGACRFLVRPIDHEILLAEIGACLSAQGGCRHGDDLGCR
jgi:two-component system cell cycle response regulator